MDHVLHDEFWTPASRHLDAIANEIGRRMGLKVYFGVTPDQVDDAVRKADLMLSYIPDTPEQLSFDFGPDFHG